VKLYLKLTKVAVLFYIKSIASDIPRGFATGLAPEVGALSKRIKLMKYSLY
jgi:hypothetical protein